MKNKVIYLKSLFKKFKPKTETFPKEILEELKDVAFLSQQELVQLPKWMLKTLNVRIEDAPDVPESGEAVAEESSTTSF